MSFLIFLLHITFYIQHMLYSPTPPGGAPRVAARSGLACPFAARHDAPARRAQPPPERYGTGTTSGSGTLWRGSHAPWACRNVLTVCVFISQRMFCTGGQPVLVLIAVRTRIPTLFQGTATNTAPHAPVEDPMEHPVIFPRVYSTPMRGRMTARMFSQCRLVQAR